jgi:hypothetical protein
MRCIDSVCKNLDASSIPGGIIIVREIRFFQKRYSAAQKIISKNSAKSTADDI